MPEPAPVTTAIWFSRRGMDVSSEVVFSGRMDASVIRRLSAIKRRRIGYAGPAYRLDWPRRDSSSARDAFSQNFRGRPYDEEIIRHSRCAGRAHGLGRHLAFLRVP